MKILVFGKGGISAGIKKVLEPRDHDVLELDRFDCDVRDQYDVRRRLEAEKPDWVINCAGISNEHLPEATFETNLVGSYYVAKACFRTYPETPVIMLASVAGLYGKPDHAAYSASKSGVISLVQSYGFNHKIWAISPGRVDTPMRQASYPDDTKGSRLEPERIGLTVTDIMAGLYPSGTNVIVRKVGLESIEEYPEVNKWKYELRVGLAKTI